MNCGFCINFIIRGSLIIRMPRFIISSLMLMFSRFFGIFGRGHRVRRFASYAALVDLARVHGSSWVR
jgi:hypothetical protein